jgi:hypothetical protein
MMAAHNGCAFKQASSRIAWPRSPIHDSGRPLTVHFSFVVRVLSDVGVLPEAGMMTVMPVWGPRHSALSATALGSIFVALVVLMFAGSAILIAILS